MKIEKEKLELMSHVDIAYEIIKEKGNKNTPNLFKEICDLLKYDDNYFENEISDFYTKLTIDKRFIFLENTTWDLREKYNVEKEKDLEEDLEEDMDINDEEIDEIEEKEDTNNIEIDDEDNDFESNVIDEDLSNLVIINENDLDNNM